MNSPSELQSADVADETMQGKSPQSQPTSKKGNLNCVELRCIGKWLLICTYTTIYNGLRTCAAGSGARQCDHSSWGCLQGVGPFDLALNAELTL